MILNGDLFHTLLVFQDDCWGQFNPNKAGLFEGSFSWGGGGGQFDPPPILHIYRRTYLIST